MSADEEWGPWIEHHGGEQPVPDGIMVEVVMLDGDKDCEMSQEFVWEHKSLGQFWPGYIIRYRIRQPRGLAILRALIAADPIKPKVDA